MCTAANVRLQCSDARHGKNDRTQLSTHERDADSVWTTTTIRYLLTGKKVDVVKTKKRNALRDRVKVMRAKAIKTTSLAQQLYMTNFYKHVKWVPAFAKDSLVYLDKAASTTSTKVDDTLKKLRKKKTGSQEMVEGQPKTVTLRKDGILDTLFIDKISIAQRVGTHHSTRPVNEDIDKTGRIVLRAIKHATNNCSAQENKNDNEQVSRHLNIADEYVVDQIVDHTVERGRMLYRIQW